MRITHIALKNWLNFRKVEVALAESVYVIGPNAAGKSNFLDVFRFLRTLSSPSGGGLSKAVAERGGLKKLRCLQARRDPEVRIEVRVVSGAGESQKTWDYALGSRSFASYATKSRAYRTWKHAINTGTRRVLGTAKSSFPMGHCV